MTGTSIRRLHEPGFTLFEVLLAMGIMATALFAVFRLQAQSLDLQSEARFTTMANFLLQERLSLYHATKTLQQGSFSGDFEDPFEDFTYSEEVSEVPGKDRLYRIRVEITQEGGKPRRTLSQETYLDRDSM